MTPSPSIAPDSDVATTTTLLRAPAAVVLAAFFVGLMAGVAALPEHASETYGPDAWWYVALALVALPFFLPSEWYRAGRRLMRAWIFGAAVIASARVLFMCVWLYSRRPAEQWLAMIALYLAVLGTLWLAVFAVHRSPVPRP